MRRLGRVVFTPFGFATMGCLLLLGWALWTGGIADGPIAKQVRVSSVYAAPGVELDTAAAERIIGNRRLVVVMMEPGARLRDGCDEVRRAAAGSVVILLSHDDDDYDTYGCSLIKRTDKELGRAAVVELTMTDGIDEFHDRPL